MKEEIAIFAAGCFWGVQAKFSRLKGVLDTTVGYTGGHTVNPSYEAVCSHKTGHAEAIQILFNPDIISYSDLLDTFWAIHNPTTKDRQGPDIGYQYRSAIFYHNLDQKKLAESSKQAQQSSWKDPIVTDILPAVIFYKAEGYHQHYLQKKR